MYIHLGYIVIHHIYTHIYNIYTDTDILRIHKPYLLIFFSLVQLSNARSPSNYSHSILKSLNLGNYAMLIPKNASKQLIIIPRVVEIAINLFVCIIEKKRSILVS